MLIDRRKKVEAKQSAIKTMKAATNSRSREGLRTSYTSLKSIQASSEKVEEACEDLERELGILRWTTETPDYIAALDYYNNRKYHRALDKLQYLVVQRLMELHKCHIRGTSELNSTRGGS